MCQARRLSSDHYDIFGDAIVQEIIPSGDGDVFAIASYSDSQGKVRASVCWRKLRQYRPDYGATCYGVTEHHPELERRNRTFLEAIGYKGFSMSEFAQSRADAHMYFLELNTRTSWPNQLFVDAGVDLTQLGYIDMSRSDLSQKQTFVPREGIIWVDFRRDRASARIKRKQGEIGLWEWLFSLTRARSFAHWNMRDPLPFLMISLWRVRRFLRKFHRS
jgi:predicted ATP-grasp superfamily ATP-dependent carboligase